MLHCCDISHPAKKWDLHFRWTSQLLEEFFLQGDKEKELGLPFSPLCDRKNTLVAESQIGTELQRIFSLEQTISIGASPSFWHCNDLKIESLMSNVIDVL